MINNIFGTVVLARIPFTDLTQIKKRPAIIISSELFYRHYKDVLLIGVTGQKKTNAFQTDIQIDDWQIAGLPKASFIKPILFTAIHSQIERQFGTLSVGDIGKVKSLLREMLSL